MKKPLFPLTLSRGFLIASSFAIQLLASPNANAQLAPPGYTGAINTPTADVLGYGHLVGSMSNTIPELPRVYPGVGNFGGTNLGFGLTPDFEAIGRLTYDGDLWCDQYNSNCKTTTRDISFSGKYRLPFGELPFNARFAVGMTDYGGSATRYRQAYGVATANLGSVEVSLGESKATQGGLMHGAFGNVSFELVDNFRLIAESDTREKRLGFGYRAQITSDLGLGFGASRKVTNNTEQQRNQLTLTLTYAMDGKAVRTGQSAAKIFSTKMSKAFETWPAQIAQTSESFEQQIALTHQYANNLSAELERAGFAEISIGKDGTLWHIKAEPRSWRKNRLDALGVLIAQWQKNNPGFADQVVFTLTFLQHPVLQARTNRACIEYFVKGVGICDAGKPFAYKDDPLSMEADLKPVNWLVSNASPQFLRPDVELSPSASYVVGSEFGIYDYSIGISTGFEVPLYKGFFWQGYHTRLITQTDDFNDPQSYFRRVGLGETTARGASMFSYIRPVYSNLWVEAAAGSLSASTKGTTLNSVWISDSGKFKLSATRGNYKQITGHGIESLKPSFVTARYALVPGFWALSVTQGTFLNNDPGYQFMSSHTYGDNRVRFFLRKTGPGNFQTPKKLYFAGFSITLPIGPKESFKAGPITVRGRDQYSLGLETKIKDGINYIEPGYGLYPFIRHGLNTDVGDYDRGDVASIEANLHRLISSIREHAKY